MKISELIQFAEEQARIERENPQAYEDPDWMASWADTLEGLKIMKETRRTQKGRTVKGFILWLVPRRSADDILRAKVGSTLALESYSRNFNCLECAKPAM